MINKQNLQAVLDLAESCSPELKKMVEGVLKHVPQSIANTHNTINYFSKSTRGRNGFNIVGRENEQTSYLDQFTGTKLTFESKNILQHLFICDSIYLEKIKKGEQLVVPILRYKIVKDGATKDYDLIIKHYQNGGYSLSVYQQNSANFQNLAKEIKRSYLTEEEFNNIVGNQVAVLRR